MTRMTQLKMIWSMSIDSPSVVNNFNATGNFSRVPKVTLRDPITTERLPDDLQNKGPENYKYFYLGDLLYVILDCQYQPNGNAVEGSDNIKYILTDFQYNNFLPLENGDEPPDQRQHIPLASVPITVDYLKTWFHENIVGTDRSNMPVMDFILEFLNDVVGDMLSEFCFNQEPDKSLFFRATSVSGTRTNNLAKHVSDESQINNSGNFIVGPENQTDHQGYIPIPKAKMNEPSIQYVVFYADTTSKKLEEFVDPFLDFQKGIYHFHVGADRGILKTASWSKVNVEYLRESRMFRNNSFGDYAQLSNFYNVSAKMFGNFLFLPGMKIYINPFGLGGVKMGNTFEDFINGEVNFARLMGIGGYHLVTKVNCTIGADGFETDLDCRFEQGGGGPREIATKPVETNVGDEASDSSADTVHCTTGILISAAANVDALQGTADVTDPEFINNSGGDADGEATTPTADAEPTTESASVSPPGVPQEAAETTTPTEQTETTEETNTPTSTENQDNRAIIYREIRAGENPPIRFYDENGDQLSGDLAGYMDDSTYDIRNYSQFPGGN